MKAINIELSILESLLKEDGKTATDFPQYSNANQYFCNLVDAGLLVSRWGFKGTSRVKYRYIINRLKATAFIKRHRGVK